MKPISLFVVLCLVCISPTESSGQKKTKVTKPVEKKAEPIAAERPQVLLSKKYDEFRNSSSVNFGVAHLVSSNENYPIRVVATFSYDGKSLQAVPEYVFVKFYTDSPIGDPSSFQASNEWFVIIDGKRTRFGKMEYEVSRRIGTAGKMTEELSMLTSRNVLVGIANASSLRMQVGGIECTFTAEQLRQLKEFTNEMALGLGDLTPRLEILEWKYYLDGDLFRAHLKVKNPTKASIFAIAKLSCQAKETVIYATDRYLSIKPNGMEEIDFVERKSFDSETSCNVSFENRSGLSSHPIEATQAETVTPKPIQILKPTTKRVSGGVLQGNAIRKVQPPYPAIAKAARASGAVQVAITVSEEGRVISAEAVSGHPLLKEAAVVAARQWTFKPTELSGVLVKVEGVLTLNFMLDDESGVSPNRADDSKIYAATDSLRPTILSQEQPKYTEAARQNRIQGTVLVSAVFTADGQITNIRVIRGLPDGLNEKAIEAARKTKFQPAMKYGQPVTVRMPMEFSFNLP